MDWQTTRGKALAYIVHDMKELEAPPGSDTKGELNYRCKQHFER